MTRISTLKCRHNTEEIRCVSQTDDRTVHVLHASIAGHIYCNAVVRLWLTSETTTYHEPLGERYFAYAIINNWISTSLSIYRCLFITLFTSVVSHAFYIAMNYKYFALLLLGEIKINYVHRSRYLLNETPRLLYYSTIWTVSLFTYC